MQLLRKFFITILVLIVSVAATFVVSEPASATDGYPFQNDTWCLAWSGSICVSQPADGWGFYKRECTSYVVWRFRARGIDFTNNMRGGHWGNAYEWSTNAARLGYPVNDNPSAGAIAWWSAGHVAYVTSTNGSTITTEEYNWSNDHSWHSRSISRGQAAWPNGFIHVTDEQTVKTILPSWHPWEQLNYDGLSTMFSWATSAVTSWGPGQLDFAVLSQRGDIIHAWYDGSGWHAWQSLGGRFISAPAMIAWSPGRLDVFAEGTDHQLWHIWYQGSWSNWESLGGYLTSSPAVASWGPGVLDVFARGAAGDLIHRWYGLGGWSNWESLGGNFASAPSAVSWGPNRLDVFVTGNDSQIWHRWYNGSWHVWEPLGGGLISAPTVSSWAVGRLDIFATGPDYQLWHKWYQGSWSNWESLGGYWFSAPGAVSWSPNRIDVFAAGYFGSLFHLWYG